MNYLIKFLITFVVFMGIDLLWLGIIARKLYVRFLGDFLRTPPNWPVAFVFYILFIIGLLIFVIEPAILAKDPKKALIMGSLFGFFTYMTYELTNWAVIKNWPAAIVPIDILWGIVLSASVSYFSTVIYLKFFSS